MTRVSQVVHVLAAGRTFELDASSARRVIPPTVTFQAGSCTESVTIERIRSAFHILKVIMGICDVAKSPACLAGCLAGYTPGYSVAKVEAAAGIFSPQQRPPRGEPITSGG